MKKENLKYKKTIILTALLLIMTFQLLSIESLASSKDKGDKKPALYQITVKSRNIYIPYHHMGLEKILFSNKDFKDIKINKRAGNVKFKITASKKPEEKDITEILSRVSLTPTSINIRKIRKR